MVGAEGQTEPIAVADFVLWRVGGRLVKWVHPGHTAKHICIVECRSIQIRQGIKRGKDIVLSQQGQMEQEHDDET